MPTEFKYWAFISYSHSDKKWGDWVHNALETYKVPKALVGGDAQRGVPVPSRIFPIFRDREELPTSADLGSVISKALDQSRYLIVICSPRAARSHWVSQEILDFKGLGREGRILALIVDGEPNAAESNSGFAIDSESFPEALKHPLGPNGELDKARRTEPIAADARPGKDGKTNAKLKLLAGILGVNYDDLKRRDEQRRRRRHRTVISVSAMLVLIFAALAGAALLQWQKAEIQTKIAEKQTQEAERQRGEAIARKLEAEAQKKIAEDETKVATDEKNKIEAQTVADEEDLGRKALLLGDQLTAAQHLSLAYKIKPTNPAVRLMLKTAMSDVDGLTRVLRSESGKIRRVEVAGSGQLLLTVTDDGAAQVWNTKDGSAVAVLGRNGDRFNAIQTGSLSPDVKHILFVNGSEAFILDAVGGQKIHLATLSPDEKPNVAVLSPDGRTVIATAIGYNNKHYSTLLTRYRSSDGSQISESSVPDSYVVISAGGSGTRAVLIGGPSTSEGQKPERKVRVIETQTGRVVSDLMIGQNDEVVPSPRGDLFVVSSLGGDPPSIYSAESGAQMAKLSATGITALRAHWTGSGRYLLSSDRAGETLWDASTWKPLHTWSNVAWSAATVNRDESVLAAATGQGEISVWDLHSGRLLKSFRDSIGSNEPQAFLYGDDPLRFSPDGRHLIFAGSGTCATIWEWQQVHSAQPVLSGHTGTVDSIEFNIGGTRAVTGGVDGSAIIWNAETGAAEFRLNGDTNKPASPIPKAEFSPDGSKVLAGGNFQEARLWDASNGKFLGQLDFDKHAAVIGDTIRIAMSEQGNRFVTFSGNGWGALWDLKTQKQIKSLHTGDGGGVRDVSFAKDGSEFIVADDKGFAHVFDSLRGELRRSLGKDGPPLLMAEIGPQDDQVLTANGNGQIMTWSMTDGHALVNLNSDAGSPRVNGAHFSPDGSQIVAAFSNNKIRVWNARTAQLILTLTEETLPGEMPSLGAPFATDINPGGFIPTGMLCVQYSPDGSFIAGTSDQSGRIFIWDARSGKQLMRLEGHSGRVTSLAFNADGSRLGTSSEDGTARIWNLGLESRSPAELERRISRFHEVPAR